MPIRMTDDDPKDSRDEDQGGGSGRRSGGGGEGGGLGSILALLGIVLFLFRRPKLGLAVVAVGVAVWLFGGIGDGGGDVSPGDAPPAATKRTLGIGAVLDPKVYDQALVHEPVSESALPARVSLLRWAPPRKSQGGQGSCVGWATSYAARTILHARQTGRDPATLAFSPSFTYNQIARRDCEGTYLVRALELLERTGDLPLADFGYTDRACDHRPSRDEKERAAQYRIAGFTRLSVDAGDYRTNVLALKQHLAQGAPVVIGMEVGGTFETAMRGKRVWHPTRADYDRRGDWGGHAMAVIGYDEAVDGGAFQLMNSWGEDWGEGGVAFVRYKDFDHFVKEAYGLYPMGDAASERGQKVRFGLVDNATGKHIALAKSTGPTFRTVKPIKKGTRFKVEVANTRPVYTYLFGQETDGTSYVLFPYTAKHSPYCGTTGTRVFPRQQSLTADDKGTRDAVAVVLSPRALDFADLNKRITASAGGTYAAKVVKALGAALGKKPRTRAADGVVELEADGREAEKVHAVVIELDKI